MHSNKRGLRLLLLLPFPPRMDAPHGGSQVICQFVAAIATRHHVGVLYLRGDDDPPADGLLYERCEFVEEVRHSRPPRARARRWSRYVRICAGLIRGKPKWATDWYVRRFAARARRRAHTWRPDIIQMEFSVMGQYLPAVRDCRAPRILVEHEPGVTAARDALRTRVGLVRLPFAVDLHAWRRFERRVLAQVDATVVFTERDRGAVRDLVPRAHTVRIPITVGLPEAALSRTGTAPLSVVFVGSFIHPPNVDAAMRAIADIFPRVRAQFPSATLYIVGDQPPSRLECLAGERVVVTGRVPDVAPYLDRAAVVIAPLRTGGGMRVKVLEALAAGKAIVASPLAIEGLALIPGVHALVAETDAEFGIAITALLGDVHQREVLAANARAWAERNLGRNGTIADFERLYGELIGAVSGARDAQGGGAGAS